MASLAGIDELRRAVRWADSIPERYHEGLSAIEILERFRAACAAVIGCPRCDGPMTETVEGKNKTITCDHCLSSWEEER
jgi:hypothetical protein